jgi:gamma-glutamyl phosphate reductase
LSQLDGVIDLVIPRGSNKLVSEIKSLTKIPVLGHAGKRNKLTNFYLQEESFE